MLVEHEVNPQARLSSLHHGTRSQRSRRRSGALRLSFGNVQRCAGRVLDFDCHIKSNQWYLDIQTKNVEKSFWQGKLTTTNQSFQIGLDGRARLGRNKPHALCTLQREIEGCGDWLGKINDENKFPLKGGGERRERKRKGKGQGGSAKQTLCYQAGKGHALQQHTQHDSAQCGNTHRLNTARSSAPYAQQLKPSPCCQVIIEPSNF